MSNQDEIKADIVATRAELAETADAIAAKLDVRAQASERLHTARDEMSDRYERAKGAAPEPVQVAIRKAETAAQPLVNAAVEDKKRTALVVGGAIVALLVLRRIRKSKKT